MRRLFGKLRGMCNQWNEGKKTVIARWLVPGCWLLVIGKNKVPRTKGQVPRLLRITLAIAATV